MSKKQNQKPDLAKRKKKIFMVGIIIEIFICLFAILGFFILKQKHEYEKVQQVEEQLELGDQYLEDLEYEQAMESYEKAMDMDNTCEAAYIGAAQVYIEQEEFEKAEEIYLKAKEIISSKRIDIKIKKLNAKIVQREKEIEIQKEKKREEARVKKEAEKKAAEERLNRENDGKVLNIYCWNEEFKSRFENYYTVPEGLIINWIITSTNDNAYQNQLDEALIMQEDVADDDKVDIFLVEPHYARKYVETCYTMDVMNEIGLSEDDVSEMYQYTKDLMTDSYGDLKGVSWQSCPSGFIYRRSIAKDVLGTDNPVEVQAALDTWEKFDAVAAKAKEKDYFMLSGFDDAYRVFWNNALTPWVIDDKISVSEEVKAWVEQTKKYTEMGYNNQANLFSEESGVGAQQNIFGYFGPGWFVDFCLLGWSLEDNGAEYSVENGTYGDWALCKGPQGSFWGGTFICVATGTDNLEVIKEILYTLTCDKETLVEIATEMGDFTNNVAAMEEIANSDFAHPFLGGQNHISAYLESATTIDMSYSTPYDQGLNEAFQRAMMDYFKGSVTEEEAYQKFYEYATDIYPSLTY